MKQSFIKSLAIKGLLFEIGLIVPMSSLFAQSGGFLINDSYVKPYTPPGEKEKEPETFKFEVPAGGIFAPCLDCSAQELFQLTQMQAQLKEDMRNQAELDRQNANYYADLELMMEKLKYDKTFQAELKQKQATNDFEKQLMQDVVFRTQMGLVQDALKNYKSPNEGWTTITINGVSSTPGFEAYAHGRSNTTTMRNSGHITPRKLNEQADREAKSYENYKKNPTASSYLYWQSNKKLLDTYKQCVKY